MKLLGILIFIYLIGFGGTEPALVALRTQYKLAATQKDAAVKLNELVKDIDTAGTPVMVCYKGADEMLQAKYAFNPITKLKYFNAGKILMEKAIKRDTTNLEMHFLRFTIQTNLPSFLGYNGQLLTDKQLLLQKIPELQDMELKTFMTNYLTTSVSLTAEEIKKLRN